MASYHLNHKIFWGISKDFCIHFNLNIGFTFHTKFKFYVTNPETVESPCLEGPGFWNWTSLFSQFFNMKILFDN